MHAGLVNSIGVALEDGAGPELPDVRYAVAAERTNIRLVDKAARIPPAAPQGQAVSANVFNTFRHNPTADRVRGAINTHVTGRVTIDPLLREFLLVRIGTLCRSEYEYAAHVRVGRRAGMTDADLALILADPEDRRSDDPVKLAMLAATDELWADNRISDATWAELVETGHLLPEQLIDVLISVGGYRSTSMLINSAGVQLDENMADFRFPEELR
jgi:alkylhydroperoxidase family enzyme